MIIGWLSAVKMDIAFQSDTRMMNDQPVLVTHPRVILYMVISKYIIITELDAFLRMR